MNVKEITLQVSKLNRLLRDKAPYDKVVFQFLCVRASLRKMGLNKLEEKYKKMSNEYRFKNN